MIDLRGEPSWQKAQKGAQRPEDGPQVVADACHEHIDHVSSEHASGKIAQPARVFLGADGRLHGIAASQFFSDGGG